MAFPPSAPWDTIVDFSGDLAKGNSDAALRDQAGTAAVQMLINRWQEQNPGRDDVPDFAKNIKVQRLTGFDVSSIPANKIKYKPTVDLQVWVVNGPA